MKPLHLLLYAAALAVISPEMAAQTADTFEQYSQQMRAKFERFKMNAENEYEKFRQKANEDYAAFLKKAWERYEAMRTPVKPKEDPPIVPPRPYDKRKDPPVKDTPKPIEEVITPPTPLPQPEPVAPITPTPISVDTHKFVFYGTELSVSLDDCHRFRIDGTEANAIAKGWATLSDKKYDNVVAECLKIRSDHHLSDWSYLMMLREMTRSFLGTSNEAVLMMAYIYCQSGYKMRLGTDSSRLYMLYASRHRIYNHIYFEMDGTMFYPLDCAANRIYISDAKFPNEQSLSLYIRENPALALSNTPERTLTSKLHPEMSFKTTTNDNLIKLYNDYPTSEVGGNFMTRWAMYAETPISENVRESLYPRLKQKLAGKSEQEAVGMLLNWVQTAFEYKLDDDIWGCDRAFFADETLYYPYCDCEDRSILFSRLVRDLIGLDVVLVYYPGHLATAVKFGAGNVKGDYLSLSGQKFVICDPTFIGAPIGMTMPGMDNSAAKVILITK